MLSAPSRPTSTLIPCRTRLPQLSHQDLRRARSVITRDQVTGEQHDARDTFNIANLPDGPVDDDDRAALGQHASQITHGPIYHRRIARGMGHFNYASAVAGWSSHPYGWRIENAVVRGLCTCRFRLPEVWIDEGLAIRLQLFARGPVPLSMLTITDGVSSWRTGHAIRPVSLLAMHFGEAGWLYLHNRQTGPLYVDASVMEVWEATQLPRRQGDERL